MYDIIVHRTRLVDVPSQHAHIAVFTISTCFESSSCYDEKILDNTIFLKESCDWTTGLKSEFMNNNCTLNVLYLFSQLIVWYSQMACHKDRTGVLQSYV